MNKREATLSYIEGYRSVLFVSIIVTRTRRHTELTKTYKPGGKSGFGGLEDACWPLVPKFVGSNPAEAVGFFRAKNYPSHLPSEGK
jgi:hypothetical protein